MIRNDKSAQNITKAKTHQLQLEDKFGLSELFGFITASSGQRQIHYIGK
jgi:hypothetical protein